MLVFADRLCNAFVRLSLATDDFGALVWPDGSGTIGSRRQRSEGGYRWRTSVGRRR